MFRSSKFLSILPLAFAAVWVSPAAAQDVKTSTIVDGLASKKKPLTRSFGKPKPTMSDADQKLLRSLGRGIKFVVTPEAAKTADKTEYGGSAYQANDLAKIEAVVEKYDLPRLDFEIGFEFGSDEVKGSSISQIVELAKALNHPSLANTRIILGGHTDAKGSDSFNQDLSQRRSNSVARLIVQIGDIKQERLVPVGFGEHKLKNAEDPHSAENRRVEIINISEY